MKVETAQDDHSMFDCVMLDVGCVIRGPRSKSDLGSDSQESYNRQHRIVDRRSDVSTHDVMSSQPRRRLR